MNGEIGQGNCLLGEDTETSECIDLTPCCSFDSWSSWNECNFLIDGQPEFCDNDQGTGEKTRSREVLCGRNCSETSQSISCILPKCPGWASWANWSVCSGDDKGTNGTRARTRVCTGATIGSRWCPAEQAPESQLLGYLQIDSCSFLQGFANSWTEWSACSVTCGVGLQRRERPCLTGELGLSEDCPLDFGLEERPCAEKSCECIQVAPFTRVNISTDSLPSGDPKSSSSRANYISLIIIYLLYLT